MKNALLSAFAVLAVYVVAFFTITEVKLVAGSYYGGVARTRVPRWITPGNKDHLVDHWYDTFFAPLMWAERQKRPPEYWLWKPGQPKPDWMTSSKP